MGALVDGMAEGSVRPIDPLIASHFIMSSVNSAFEMRSWASKQPMAQATATYQAIIKDGLFDPEA